MNWLDVMEGLIWEVIQESDWKGFLSVLRLHPGGREGMKERFKLITTYHARTILSAYTREDKFTIQYVVNWGQASLESEAAGVLQFDPLTDMIMDDPRFPEAFKKKVRKQIVARYPEILDKPAIVKWFEETHAKRSDEKGNGSS